MRIQWLGPGPSAEVRRALAAARIEQAPAPPPRVADAAGEEAVEAPPDERWSEDLAWARVIATGSAETVPDPRGGRVVGGNAAEAGASAEAAKAAVATDAAGAPDAPDARGAYDAPDGTVPWIWWCAREVPLAAALEAARRGAYESIAAGSPGAVDRLVRRLRELAEPEPAVPREAGVVVGSAAARAVLRQVARAARTNVPVLLMGETGTGKEETARLVHRWSGRKGPWLPINCAAIPNELMESELFGHARGAFSGAVASVDGKLLAARGGTVFLDEIDDTPFSTQMKLLRVLEDGQVTRVGETVARRADFRLVAATNRDLLRLVEQDRFGRDLYERLAIVRIELAPLRERLEDIPALVEHFVRRFQDQHGLPARPLAISDVALAALRAHAWPGNIRELRNVVFQALVGKRGGDELLLSDLPRLLHPAAGAPATESRVLDGARVAAAIDAGSFDLRRELEHLERTALAHALVRSHGNAAEAARRLGAVGRGQSSDPAGTVRAMMRRLGVASDGSTLPAGPAAANDAPPTSGLRDRRKR